MSGDSIRENGLYNDAKYNIILTELDDETFAITGQWWQIAHTVYYLGKPTKRIFTSSIQFEKEMHCGDRYGKLAIAILILLKQTRNRRRTKLTINLQ